MRVSAALSDFTNNSADFHFLYFVEKGYENFRQIFFGLYINQRKTS